jgi:hypothetical protein
MQQSDPFAAEGNIEKAHSGDVAARPVCARYGEGQEAEQAERRQIG